MPTQDVEQMLLAAIDSIHAAATGEMTWSTALECVCNFMGARAADLNVLSAQTLAYVAFHPARVDPFVLRYIADYMQDVSNENPRIRQVYLPMAEGRIVADTDIWAREELDKIPFFADFLQTWGTFDSLNTWVRRGDDGAPWIALAVHFSREKCPPQQEERRRLALLLPHFKRACGVEERLGLALQAQTGLQQALDHVDQAVMLLDPRGKVVQANHRAWQLAGQHLGLGFTHDRCLRLDSAQHQNQLLAALHRCSHPETLLDRRDTAPLAPIVVDCPGRLPVTLTVQPLARGQLHRPQAVAVVLVHAPSPSSPHGLQAFRESYGLTPAEVQLVCGLVNGQSLKELASSQGISYETVRTHLRRVFGKTGTHRQTSLIHLARTH